MKNNSVAIILLNWNNFNYTIECVRSLIKTTYKNKKIFIIDNASTDKSVEKIKKEFPWIDIILNNKNLGFTGGNNVGIEIALKEKFDYIMLLNNDTIVDKLFIEPLLNSFDSKTGAVQPLILNYYNKNIIWNFGGEINKKFGIFQSIGKKKSIQNLKNLNQKYTEWISGCCFMIKSSIIGKVGLLDNNFFVYFEDVDWSIRISKKKYNLKVVPKSIIYHHEGASWKNKKKSIEGNISPYTHYLNVRNHIYILRKHLQMFNIFGVVLFQSIKIIAYTFYFILRLRFKKLSMVYKGLFDALHIKT